MNGRERELAAIRHGLPDRIPTDAICVENTLALFDTARGFRREGYTRGG